MTTIRIEYNNSSDTFNYSVEQSLQLSLVIRLAELKEAIRCARAEMGYINDILVEEELQRIGNGSM